MAVRGEGRPSQIMRYLDVCFAKMYLYHELFLRGLTELLTLTLVWEKVTRQCHMCVILW